MNASDIIMAFVDLIPVVAFLIAAVVLQRLFFNKMSKGCFAIFSAGTIFVIVAGMIKFLQKFLLVFRIVNWDTLSISFFPLQTIGFMLAAAGLLAMMFAKQGDTEKASAIALPVFAGLLILGYVGDYSDVPAFGKTGTMIFVVLMCLGVVIFDGGIAVIAGRNKVWAALVLSIVGLVLTLAMGYFSTKDSMNDWVKEIVNSAGQGCVLASALVLKKHGIGEKTAVVSFRK